MTEIKVTINDEDQRRRAIDSILRCSLDKPMAMTLKPFESKRTLPANALYWQWMTTLAKYFSANAGPFDREDMHELLKHKFLGYQDERMIGKTVIPRQLKSTAKLTKGDMSHYMEQVDAWAADNGCLLPRPEDNEYDQWRAQQNG